MDTPQTAEQPSKFARLISKQIYTAIGVGYVGLLVATTLIFVSGGAATVEANGNTSFLYGWNHGFYVLPGFVASIASDKYSIYQNGGNGLYNFGFLVGVYFAFRTTKILLRK